MLLKNTKSTGTVAPNFEPETLHSVSEGGTSSNREIQEGAVCRRDSSWVKPYVSSDEVEAAPEDIKIKLKWALQIQNEKLNKNCVAHMLQYTNRNKYIVFALKMA